MGIRFDELSLYGQKQLVNHIINHDEITMKDNLFHNLSAYCKNNGLNVFDYVPLTFVLDYDQEREFKTNSQGQQIAEKYDKMCVNLTFFSHIFYIWNGIKYQSDGYHDEANSNINKLINETVSDWK